MVCGYVIDQELKIPLESATVIGQNSATTTNSFGYFELEASGINESISVSYLGFKSLSKNAIEFDAENCSYLYLIPKAEPLQEVLLSGYLGQRY